MIQKEHSENKKELLEIKSAMVEIKDKYESVERQM